MSVRWMFDGIFARMYLLDTRNHRLPQLHAKHAEFAPETLFAHLEPVEGV